MKWFLGVILLVVFCQLNAQTGKLQGIITDENLEPVEFATLTLQTYSEEVVASTTSMENGAFEFYKIKPGIYRLFMHYAGERRELNSVIIHPDKTTRLDEQISLQEPCPCQQPQEPLFNITDHEHSGASISGKSIREISGGR